MKKIVKKLALNKQTMALLDDKEMTNVKGGIPLTWDGSAACPFSKRPQYPTNCCEYHSGSIIPANCC